MTDKETELLPPTLLVPAEDLLYTARTSPELRRADMYNRARREEMDAMLYDINPRQGVSSRKSRGSMPGNPSIGELLTRLRNGLGNALVSAGTRIQNPA